MNTAITLLTDDDLDAWLDANEATRGRGHLHRLARFWQEMQEGKRLIWAAWAIQGATPGADHPENGKIFLGHISLQHTSFYPPFRKQHIPEIVDVWVQPDFRRHSIGRRLLGQAVDFARQNGAPAIGLGVGVTKSYGAAHVLYMKQGFMPDGSGLWVDGEQAGEAQQITLGPEAILMWVKPL